MSIREEVQHDAEAMVLDKLLQIKGAKGKKKAPTKRRKRKGDAKGRNTTKSRTPTAQTPRVAKQKSKGSQFSVTAMMGMLNQRINEKVKENMGDPRLNNRTGAFAASVRITDVTKTPQGFPSVGYTYEKNPYQTFEIGYAQGSQDRDPRKLIDLSIRQLAAEMALGRLYTRRV